MTRTPCSGFPLSAKVVICAGKQLALPASRQHVTPPKYCTIALGRKKRHSTRHQGIVLSLLSATMPDAGSSATQPRQLRCSALHLQPPQRWYLVKRCLVSSAAASPMTNLLHSYLPSQLLLPTCATDKLYVHSPLLPGNSRLHDCQMR
jgi:hypothetical protein